MLLYELLISFDNAVRPDAQHVFLVGLKVLDRVPAVFLFLPGQQFGCDLAHLIGIAQVAIVFLEQSLVRPEWRLLYLVDRARGGAPGVGALGVSLLFLGSRFMDIRDSVILVG